MVFETEPVVERMNPVARMATRGDELVAAVALRLRDDALHQRRSDLTTSMVRINEHILHQPKRLLVEIVRHHVQVGSANNLALESLGDLHAICRHTDGLEAGSLHGSTGTNSSAGITDAPPLPRRPRCWRSTRETHRRRGPVEQEDYPRPSRTPSESAFLLRRSTAGRSQSREYPRRPSTTCFGAPWQTPRGPQLRMGTGPRNAPGQPGGHPRRISR